MRAVAHQLRRATKPSFWNQQRFIGTRPRVFEEGDIAVLRPIDDHEREPFLTKPLKHNGSINTRRGAFKHIDIIGKEARSNVTSSAGGDMRAHIPTLAEYTALTPRRVTPVYAGEANIIVSLLDIHVTNTTEDASNGRAPLEILEAGTGHGALTLHLARAIHAANGSPPDRSVMDDRDSQRDKIATSNELWTKWKQSRKATIHTVDISSANSAHARDIVDGFRRGIYAGNVDFHVGDVPSFIQAEFERRQSTEPFLSHVILDLPGPNQYLQQVASAMLVDASLAVFCPNVTQIGECVKVIHQLRHPLIMDKVVELGANNSVGRAWDVRAVQPRAVQSQRGNETSPDIVGMWPRMKNVYRALRGRPTSIDRSANAAPGSGWEVVCRPKTRFWVHGGGFLGLWKRMKQ